jgi:hypothetical protein
MPQQHQSIQDEYAEQMAASDAAMACYAASLKSESVLGHSVGEKLSGLA